jgi:hypothetical protein
MDNLKLFLHDTKQLYMTVKFPVFFLINKMTKYERKLTAKNHGAQVYFYQRLVSTLFKHS